jgi:hypothetical protein
MIASPDLGDVSGGDGRLHRMVAGAGLAGDPGKTIDADGVGLANERG